ncbi:MAG: alpha/beta hydrolase [Flavobacteriaceae bacterium]|nr:alpha/beta hydrolase [Flavobacteriaceae bacterium]
MRKLLKILSFIFLLILVSLILLGYSGVGNLTTNDAKNNTFININNEKIRYIQKGEGQDILLIHGTPGCLEDWDLVTNHLSKNYRVTAFDRLGNSFTSSNNYNYTLKENAAVVHQLINVLKLRNVVIIGHSYGGSTTAQLAVEDNPKIDSYIMVAPPLYGINPGILYKIASLPVIGKGFAYLMHITQAKSVIREAYKSSMKNKPELLTDDFLNFRADVLSQPKVLYTTSKERTNYNVGLDKISPKYNEITKRVSIIVGDSDYKNLMEGCDKFKKVRPQTNILILKNTGHFIQMEKTEELLNFIDNHLEKNIETEYAEN